MFGFSDSGNEEQLLVEDGNPVGSNINQQVLKKSLQENKNVRKGKKESKKVNGERKVRK